MRVKYIALTALALAAAIGIGVGTAFYQHAASRTVAKNVPPDHDNLKTFVQTANNWLSERQQTASTSLFMADSQTGWRTDGKNIFRTTDGGAHWEAAAPFYDGQAVDFVDGTHAFALAKAVKDEEALTGISVYATADGGSNWRHTTLSGAPFFSSDAIVRGVDGFSMANLQNGLLVLAGDSAAGHHESAVFSTKDGARSFQKETDSLRLLNGQTTLASADEKHAYLFVNGSAAPVFMTATTDGGKTWKEQDDGLTARYTDVTPTYVPVRTAGDSLIALFSTQNGVPASGTQHKTETADTHMRNTFYTLAPDGSISGTLAELLTELPLDAKSVSMPDAQTIFVLSQADGKPVLYHFSSQGGWMRISSPTLPSDGLQIQFTDPSHGFILQKDALYHTQDGGKTWSKTAF